MSNVLCQSSLAVEGECEVKLGHMANAGLMDIITAEKIAWNDLQVMRFRFFNVNSRLDKSRMRN
jgi:hypothetical protein